MVYDRIATLHKRSMSSYINIPESITGLSTSEAEAARKQYGVNHQVTPGRNHWWQVILEMLKEPMLLLLIAVTVIYFIMGEYGEAYFMLAAIIVVSGISFYQDNRSRRALEALEKMMVQKTLSKHAGNITHAARDLGITRTALYRRIEKHGL